MPSDDFCFDNRKHNSIAAPIGFNHRYMMQKKILVAVFAVFVCFTLFAQPTSKTGIAPFKITLVNGKPYTYAQLKKNTPTVLVYFSPTCDHCKEFTKVLLKNDQALQNKQVVMVGYEPIKEVKKFDSTFHVSAHPNIKIGTEGYTFIVQKFYNVQRFPFVVMYNKQMKLVKTVPFVMKPEEVINDIKNL